MGLPFVTLKCGSYESQKYSCLSHVFPQELEILAAPHRPGCAPSYSAPGRGAPSLGEQGPDPPPHPQVCGTGLGQREAKLGEPWRDLESFLQKPNCA